MSTPVDFQAYERPLVAAEEFKYLGRVLTSSGDDWTAVVDNLRKARQDVDYFREGRSRPSELWEILQGSGTSDTPVRCRVVGDVTSDWEDTGSFPPQGGPPDGKYAAEEDRGGQADLSDTVRGNEGSGSGGCGYVRPLTP